MKLTKVLALLLTAALLTISLPACKGDTAGSTDTSADETTAAPETTVPETTKAPETTPKETEPPKVYEYTTVFELDFSKMPDGKAPFSANGISNLRIEGGLLKGTSTGGDPHMPYNGGDAVFPADSVQIIEIKYMNYSVDYNLQIFFTTETVGWSEPASFREFVDWSADDGEDNDWNIIQIDTSFCSEWVGNVTNFRIDPFSGEGDFEIAYIKFLTQTEVPQ